MIDMAISSFIFIGLINGIGLYCLNFNRYQCNHSSIFMGVFGILIIINLIFYLMTRGLKKRMIFGMNLDRTFARDHRPNENLESRNTRNENVLDIAARIPSPSPRTFRREQQQSHPTYINVINH